MILRPRPSSVLFAAFLAATPSLAFAAKKPSPATGPFVVCESTLVPPPAPLESFDQVLDAFSRGFLPDLLDPNQRAAFEIYLKLRFGDPATRLNEGTTEEIGRALRRYAELKKRPFRSVVLESRKKSYGVPKALADFIAAQSRNAAQIRSNLFQIDANAGYWKKILGYDEPEFAKIAGETKEARAARKAEATDRWEKFLDARIPPETRAKIADAKLPEKERRKILYRVFSTLVGNALSGSAKKRLLGQAQLDLVHACGFGDPALLAALKSADGYERLAAYRKILSARDEFAMEMGWGDHFSGMLRSDYYRALGVTAPSGIDDYAGLTKKLAAFEAEIANSPPSYSTSTRRTVRQLSLVESPYRSCLGGTDCSSRTYLLKALDADYHYFTLTDEAGRSSGHVTVALGEGTLDGKKVPIAFVDKIQNVGNADIPPMLEAIRRSLEEGGYRLALPVDVGNHNGLSNEEVTRAFVARNVRTEGSVVTGFRRHAAGPQFPNQYSRADASLPLRLVAPLAEDGGSAFVPAELTPGWSMTNLDFDKLKKATIALKRGGPEEKARYLAVMTALEAAGMKIDPAFEKTVSEWKYAKDTPYALRRQLVLATWEHGRYQELAGITAFSSEDQLRFARNLLDTPRFRARLAERPSDLASLLSELGGNPEAVSLVVGAYRPELVPLAKRIAATWSKEAAYRYAKTFRRLFGTGQAAFTPDELAKIDVLGRAFEGTGLEGWFYAEADAIGLGPGGIEIPTATTKEFDFSRVIRLAKELLASPDPARTAAESPAFAALRDLYARKRTADPFAQSNLEYWFGLAGVDPALKAEMLILDMGGRRTEELVQKVPASQYDAFRKALAARSFVQTAGRIGGRKKLAYSASWLAYDGQGVSFEFRPVRVEGVEIEVQATPLTQVQLQLLLGKTPSPYAKFYKDGKGALTGHLATGDLPADSMSFEEVKAILAELNGLGDGYVYRLPTISEWDYLFQRGMGSRYPSHRWDGNRVKHGPVAVAADRPNAFGLYDFGTLVQEMVTERGDPLARYAAHGGYQSSRVSRVGGELSPLVGFRLVREKKR